MTEQPQTPNLEAILLNVGQLSNVLNRLNKDKTIKDKTSSYEVACRLISGEENGENYDRVLKELTRDPVYAYKEIDGTIVNRVNQFKELYNIGKNDIKNIIENKINDSLKESKTKAEAADILIDYLIDNLIEIPEVTQEELDNKEMSAVFTMGMPYAFEAKGNVSKYKNIILRSAAAEYIKENKNTEGKVSYIINPENLNKVMDNMISASSLYTRIKTIEKIKEMQATQ